MIVSLLIALAVALGVGHDAGTEPQGLHAHAVPGTLHVDGIDIGAVFTCGSMPGWRDTGRTYVGGSG